MPTSKKTTTTETTGSSDWETHNARYRTEYATRPYYVTGMDYDTDYAPAYKYGLQLVQENSGKRYEDVATTAEAGWEKVRGTSRLSWAQAAPALREAFDQTIQLREERMKVDKTAVEAGSVHLKKEVHTEHKSVQVPVEREEVVIERRTVNKPTTAGDIKAETIKVPVTEERVTVSKESVVTEEVGVGKRKVTDNQTVEADLKREELVVESDGKATVRETGDTKTGDRKSK